MMAYLKHTWLKLPRAAHGRESAVSICKDCALVKEHPWWSTVTTYTRAGEPLGNLAGVCPGGRLRREGARP